MCVCLYGLSGRAHQKIQGHFLREPHVGNHLEQLGHHASIYIFSQFLSSNTIIISDSATLTNVVGLFH